jgi:hypothetical protein
MNQEEFKKMIEEIKGFSAAEKNLLVSSYELGFVAGSKAMRESTWADELHSYNSISTRKYDA